MVRVRCDLDEAASREIVRRYSSPVLTIASHYLHDPHRAEDAVQESFLHLVRYRKHYRSGSRFSSWFYTMVRNVCRDMIRRTKTHEAAKARLAAESAPEPPLVSETYGVARLLAHLSPIDRRILVLKVCHGLTLAEIAEGLDLTPEAAKKRAQRALRRLRQLSRAEERSGKL